jgi:hypothetical protein
MRRQLLATHLVGLNFVEAAGCSSFFQKATPAVLTGQYWVPLRPSGPPVRPANQTHGNSIDDQLICLTKKKKKKKKQQIEYTFAS